MGVYADFPLPSEWLPVLEELRPMRYRLVGRKLTALGSLVDACLALLPEERVQLIWQRFGPEKTLQEIGDYYGITRERVRQVVNKVSRAFLRDPQLRLVLNGVFTGLSKSGAIVVNVRGATSERIPEAQPDELWNFVMNVWNEAQSLPARSVRLEEGLHLFSPDGLPTETRVKQVMSERGSFLYPSQLAVHLNVPREEVEALACAFPNLVRTRNGMYGFLGWTAPQLIKATAEQLARTGFMDWHFSEIGKAISVFDSSYEGQSSRNVAAVLARRDVHGKALFESAGRNGFWRLAALGDGHADNYAAIQAVLAEADYPLHWTEIQGRLKRTVNEGTILALVGREAAFQAFGRGVFGLKGKSYPDSTKEDAFMQGLFQEHGLEALPVSLAEEVAVKREIDPQRLITAGRTSRIFRYWKWGDNEPQFLTVAESQRRHFDRWFYRREERETPDEDILLTGLQAAFERKDAETLRLTYEFLKGRNVELPGEAIHWVDWALGA